MSVWGLSVSLNAVDISASLTGRVEVPADESVARIASFIYKPAAGVIDVADWIGAAVTIDYIADPLGVPVVTRLFTGKVNLPTYDPVTRLVAMDCTDDQQGHFEAMDEATILLAITGGKYSIPVFGEREDGWQQAMDVLSTVPKAYDLNRDGITATLTDWAAAAPTYSYTAAQIKDESIGLDLVETRALVNRVNIDTQYRFTRLHHREHTFGWNYGSAAFCDFLLDSYDLPIRDMIASSANDAAWGLQGGIVFETYPDSATFPCSPDIVWNVTEEQQNLFCTNATWTAVRRWTQTITESYTITVEDASSITRFGLSQTEDGAGHQQEYDDAQYDMDEGTSTPAWTVNAIFDYTEDQVDRVASDNAIETLIQIASSRILSTHRQNFLTATVAIEPGLERFHTVSINDGLVSGTAKVFSYTHVLDINTGAALTEVTIAVSKSGSGGGSDPLTAPAAPDTQPSHAAPANNTVLPNRIGNDDTVADYDETWTGFTGNYTVVHGAPTPAQIYPRRMRIVTPDIETESRDEVEGLSVTTYNVQAPDETLVINA